MLSMVSTLADPAVLHTDCCSADAFAALNRDNPMISMLGRVRGECTALVGATR